jgi:hypothetical protein
MALSGRAWALQARILEKTKCFVLMEKNHEIFVMAQVILRSHEYESPNLFDATVEGTALQSDSHMEAQLPQTGTPSSQCVR